MFSSVSDQDSAMPLCTEQNIPSYSNHFYPIRGKASVEIWRELNVHFQLFILQNLVSCQPCQSSLLTQQHHEAKESSTLAVSQTTWHNPHPTAKTEQNVCLTLLFPSRFLVEPNTPVEITHHCNPLSMRGCSLCQYVRCAFIFVPILVWLLSASLPYAPFCLYPSKTILFLPLAHLTSSAVHS